MKLIIAAAFAALFAMPAAAADIGVKDYPAQREAAPSDVVTWAGLSFGVQLGVSNPTHEIDVNTVGEGESFNLFHVDGLGGMGLNGRLFAQYDVEILNDWVIGARGWYGLGNAKTEVSAFDGELTAQIEEDRNYGGLVRLGRIVGGERRGLIYGLIGYGVVDYEISSNADISDFINTDLQSQGLIAGGGLEYALSRSVFFSVEYQHMFADGKNVTKGDLADFIHADVTSDVDAVHAGLRVKF